MTGIRRTLTAIALAIVIVGVVGFTIWRTWIKGPTVPEFVRLEGIELIDKDSLELITETREYWKRHGAREGLCRNPNTGDYTMAPAIYCPACHEKIPFPIAEALADPSLNIDFTCPRCGEHFRPELIEHSRAPLRADTGTE